MTMGKTGRLTLRDVLATLVMLSSAPTLVLIFTVGGPLLPSIAAEFGKDGPPLAVPAFHLIIDATLFAQLVAALPSLGLIVGGWPAGLAIERLGARRVLIGSLAIFALLGTAAGAVHSPALLLALRLALGFAAVGCATAALWLVGAVFDDHMRARILSLRNIFGGIGGVVSTLAVGALAAHFGWRGAFALYLAPLLIVPLATTVLPAIPGRPTASGGQGRGSLRPIWPILASVFALSIVMMMNTTQFPFLLAENGVTSAEGRSHVMVVGSIATMGGSALYALVGPRLDLRWNYSLIALALGAGVVTVGLSHEAVLSAVGGGLIGFGSGMLAPHFIRIILQRAPAEARGRAVGLALSSIYLGDFVNPIVVHPLAVAIGLHDTFLLLGAIVLSSSLQVLLPRPARRAAISP